MTRATVVGAGLAGCEAAWQLARRGVSVTLYDMKPARRTPAHTLDTFAELCCSNSLRSDRLSNAVGLLKAEMRLMDSLILAAADAVRVPAGGALAVDRVGFSREVTRRLLALPNVAFVSEEATSVPDGDTIVATGPLTSDALSDAIARLPGLTRLHFYDAAAPIVVADSLDESRVFRQSRYGRGDDYLNCPMTREEYEAFVRELLAAQTAPVHGFEESRVFEGCMPVESLARRGQDALAFGPLKPVGLTDPRTGRRPYACVQLRQDDAANTLYNLVGFQTRLTFPEQRRVFGMIPGLSHAEFARYGVMHRNTFLNSPGFLNAHYQARACERLFFAGQMTGVEGYVESAGSGLVAGVCLAERLRGRPMPVFPPDTALGAMARYVSADNRRFQPMNCAFGLIDQPPRSPGAKRVPKAQRYDAVAARALAQIANLAEKLRV